MGSRTHVKADLSGNLDGSSRTQGKAKWMGLVAGEYKCVWDLVAGLF